MFKAENKYEMAYLLSPEINEEKLDLETAELQKIITENGGEIVELGAPKKRWLSYKVRKQNQAYFGVIYFKIPSENIDRIKNILLLHRKILRFLILSNSQIKLNDKLIDKLANNRIKDKNGNIHSELKSNDLNSKEKLQDELTNGQSFERKLESILNG